jgi:NADH-quinone oxidoreductase subunit G
MPVVKINGVQVEVPEGTNMIEAAAKVGVAIPHYCYHPHLSVAGNCRMCLVDIEAGGRGPDIACNMKARDGLAIRTDSPQVAQMRKSVMEFLLANHPLDCPICDQAGECRLQDYYTEHGNYESRLVDAKVAKPKRQDIGEHIVLDSERCVACSRCVRFGDEVTETGELRLFNRGDHTEIGIFPGERLSHQYQGVLADICPVGALTNKEFRFTKRVWYLRETDSVCTGCATGCNTRVCHENGEVFRYLPRRNDEVNKSWMCDPGRAGQKDIAGSGRLLRGKVDGKAADFDAALAAAIAALRGVGATQVAAVLGTQASNEANWALYKLVRENLPGARLFVSEGNDPGASDYHDRILVSADKNPNSFGAHRIAEWDGHVDGLEGLRQAVKGGQVKVLLTLEDDVIGRAGLSGSVERVVHFGWRKSATSEAATVVVPTAHPVEQDATWTNRTGRVQRGWRSVNPAGESQPAYLALDRLGAGLGRAPSTSVAAAAFKSLAEKVTGFQGMSYASLGKQGQALVELQNDAPTSVVQRQA